jgi:hypothetical protein
MHGALAHDTEYLGGFTDLEKIRHQHCDKGSLVEWSKKDPLRLLDDQVPSLVSGSKVGRYGRSR